MNNIGPKRRQNTYTSL